MMQHSGTIATRLGHAGPVLAQRSSRDRLGSAALSAGSEPVRRGVCVETGWAPRRPVFARIRAGVPVRVRQRRGAPVEPVLTSCSIRSTGEDSRVLNMQEGAVVVPRDVLSRERVRCRGLGCRTGLRHPGSRAERASLWADALRRRVSRSRVAGAAASERLGRRSESTVVRDGVGRPPGVRALGRWRACHP